MLKNYFKVAIRNILRNRIYSAINIFGLATAMTICLLIILFVIDQRRMDTHMADYDKTYRILSKFQYEKWGEPRRHASSPYKALEGLVLNHPGIAETTRLTPQKSEIRFGDHIFSFDGLYAQENFFSFFDFELREGDPGALKNPNSIVLSEELVAKLFPNVDPIGKQVEIKDLGSFLVTGVVNDLGTRTHIEFDALLSFSSYDQKPEASFLKDDWIAGAKHFHNYFKVEEDQLSDIQATLNGFISLLPDEHQDSFSFTIQPISDNSLGEVVANRLGFVAPFFVAWFLGILAAVVMFSATFNYVGLAIALGLKRAKEVGIRKIVGAAKRQVFIQFLVEAQVTILFSWILSLALLSFLIPAYNELKVLRDIDGQITIDLMENLHIYFIFLAFAVFIGLLAGGYPAWFVGGMSYSKALGKDSKAKSPSFLLRKGLIFVQYTTSVVFIITAIVLFRQSAHFFEMDYGFDKTNLINVPLKEVPYETFKTELMRDPQIEGVSLTSAMPGLVFADRIDVYKPGAMEPISMSTFSVNEDFLQNFGIDLIKGKNFNNLIQSDKEAVLINAKAAEALGIEIENPNAIIRLTEGGEAQRILGVVNEFKFDFLFRESGPLVLTYAHEGPRFVNIRYRDWDEKTAAAAVENAWRQFDELHPFEYTYYEFQLNDIYGEFTDLARIVGLVAALAILIACLGQFGMILHHVQLKIKEVGIRKALGANIRQLIYLLSRGYLMLIVVSVIVGTPLAWWINVLWTNKLAYSVTINWWTVVLGLVLVFGLAIASIVSLTWKTANTNPVESLKYE